jgi:WhiB family redox-sensing transcriptional regulator
LQARSPSYDSYDQQLSKAKREGMALMQRPDASFEAVAVMDSCVDHTAGQGGIAALFSYTNVPVGRDLPCADDPELFFAEAPADVEAAKALCQGCRIRVACLESALGRREPWGVWGGELLLRGTVVPRKRPRGRPRKADADELAKADERAA